MKEKIEAVFAKWWNKHIPGSPLGATTEVHNYLHINLPELKDDILKLFGDEKQPIEPKAKS